MIRVTRRVEFSAAHFYHNPAFSAEENKRVFGKCSNLHGHGHNYVLEVTVAGEPDSATGMVLDLKELKDILQREVVDRMDHRHLNHEVPELAGKIPTCENIAAVIWNLLDPRIKQGRLDRVRLYESPDLFADCTAESNGDVGFAGGPGVTAPLKLSLTRRYRFAASHRLHSAQFSEEENLRLYGKCSNPYGHGHNYIVEVTIAGPVDPATGMIANLGELDPFVEREVIEAFDQKYLNEEIPQFSAQVPTTENVCREIYRRLKPFPAARLERVRIEETSNNSFEFAG